MGKSPVLCAALLAVSMAAFAGRTPGYSMSAFNAVVSDSSCNAVFAPYSWELDLALLSEGFGSVDKAKFIERLGALTGYENVYEPINGRYAAGATNGFRVVSARAVLTPSLALVHPSFRQLMQKSYRAQACPCYPSAEPAECWLKAAMDGEMEDFKVPDSIWSAKRISFCDLEAIHLGWAEAFPTNAASVISFRPARGAATELPALRGVQRSAGLWTTRRFTMLRLAMADGAYFFAAMPVEGAPLSSIRDDFAGDRLEMALVALKSVTELGVYSGPLKVTLPRLQLDTVVPLAPAFREAELPMGGFERIRMREAETLSEPFQRTKFALGSEGGTAREEDNRFVPSVPAKEFVLDRPFLFFVYHEPTRTVPVAGLFTGK